MKLLEAYAVKPEAEAAFSILERIDVGETTEAVSGAGPTRALSVSSNGSTWVKREQLAAHHLRLAPFSILERIDVGETSGRPAARAGRSRLSVSSNGSTWVKLQCAAS